MSDNLSNDERRGGNDRRTENAPLIVIESNRPALIISGLTGLVATIALVVSLIGFGQQLQFIQQSRQRSATDNCHLIRAISLYATTSQGRPTGPTLAFLNHVGLGDCNAYGKAVRLSK